MSTGYDEAEAAIVAIARGLVRGADPSTVKRILAGEIELALVERNDVAALIEGLPIEAAYEALSQHSTSGTALKKYFGPPSFLSTKTAPAGSSKPVVIAAILQDAYGQAYTPPPKPRKAAKSTTSKTPKPATGRTTQTRQPFDATAIATALQSAASEIDAREVVTKIGRSKPNHQAVASLLGVEFAAKDPIAALQDAIVRQAVTRRLEHAAYLRRAQPASIQN